MDRAVSYLISNYNPKGRWIGWLMMASIIVEDWDLYSIAFVLIFIRDTFQNGGNVIRSLSASFLADLEEDWRAHGKEIFKVLREKYPQAYFSGLVALSRIIRWESENEAAFDRTLTPEQVMEKLEERVGPEGRKLFEKLSGDFEPHSAVCDQRRQHGSLAECVFPRRP
jgi:hypothetical protein